MAHDTVNDCAWSVPPASLVLSHGNVHLWKASLDRPPACVRRLECTLGPDERQRADGFRRPYDRARFIVARGLLRTILGGYLDVMPGEVRFRYGSHGKPALEVPSRCGDSSLDFSLTHSEGLALYAFALESAVGIDLEVVRPIAEFEQIADRFFSSLEIHALRALPRARRMEAFMNCWTRKEAYLKATGDGLNRPLDRFSVSLAPGVPAALLDVDGQSKEVDRWSLLALKPAPGYVAALAVRGHGWRFRRWRSM